MTQVTDKLERSRLAIVEHIARRQRRHDPHEVPPRRQADPFAAEEPLPEPPPTGAGWTERVVHAVKTWWRYHPAHMAADLATPLMQTYARQKPVQLLAISLVAGAAITFARPWRLVSLTALAVAVLKSSQLSSVLMAALSAADYSKDQERPG